MCCRELVQGEGSSCGKCKVVNDLHWLLRRLFILKRMVCHVIDSGGFRCCSVDRVLDVKGGLADADFKTSWSLLQRWSGLSVWSDHGVCLQMLCQACTNRNCVCILSHTVLAVSHCL